MLKWIWDKKPRSLLDIGAGCGTYARPWLGRADRPYLIGVEAWRPYVAKFGLHDLYDHVITRDIRSLNSYEWPRADVVVLGDVLEHMTREDAVRVWELARATARKAVYLSIPVVHSPQGHVNGNPFEEHVVEDWTVDKVLTTFKGIDWQWIGTIVGRFEAVPS